MLIDFGSEQLGPRALGEPMVLRTSKRAWSNKATVTVTEYERGWTIEGAPTDRAASHHGRFTGVVRRCLINHRGRVPADCLGHLDNVAKLANKVLTTYRLSMPKMITD